MQSTGRMDYRGQAGGDACQDDGRCTNGDLKRSPLPVPLTVTLTPGQSGGMGVRSGASVLFTASGGTLSDGINSGPKIIVVTNGSGVTPPVTLTLPSTVGPVTVMGLRGLYGLGHPVATFTETAQ